MPPDRPLRFCLVTTFYPPYHFGGDGVFVYRLAEALAEQGHVVDVIHSIDAYRVQHKAAPDVAFCHHPGVRRHALESGLPGLAALVAHQFGRPGPYARRLRDLLDNGCYDVIHYHNVSLLGGPGILRLGQAVKLYTAHEYWLVCPTHVLFAFDREACRQPRCLTCTLASRRPPQLWRSTGLLRRCIRHVDCFLMPSRFAMEKHQAAGLDRPMVCLPHFVPGGSLQDPSAAGAKAVSRPYFLCVGRLERLKGVQDLIRLFATYRAADLLVVGAGSLEADLRAQARALPHVRFLGPIHPAELGPLYRRALAVLVPSLCYETFGLAAVEALAHGTPAIVRRIGALPEVIEQSQAGYTFDTLEECRARMELVRTRPAVRAELGRLGVRTARERWSLQVHLARYHELIQGLREDRLGPNKARKRKPSCSAALSMAGEQGGCLGT